jgi:hypothetical protein
MHLGFLENASFEAVRLNRRCTCPLPGEVHLQGLGVTGRVTGEEA